MLTTNANIIVLTDTEFGNGPIWLAKFDNGFGTTPNRNDAFVCKDAEVEHYIEVAVDMEKRKAKIAGLPETAGRQVSSESVVVLKNELGNREII